MKYFGGLEKRNIQLKKTSAVWGDVLSGDFSL